MATITTPTIEVQPTIAVPIVAPEQRFSAAEDGVGTSTSKATTPAAENCARPITVEEYHRMAEAGILKPEERIELIDGVIVMMSPIGSRHQACVDELTEFLAARLAGNARLRIQGSFRILPRSEPDPDVCVLRTRDSYWTEPAAAADVMLVIEVSDSSLDYDRRVKTPLYAKVGIPEFWIVDLAHDLVEIRRKPNGDKYEELQTLRRGDHATCSTLPQLKVEVAAMLGPVSSTESSPA